MNDCCKKLMDAMLGPVTDEERREYAIHYVKLSRGTEAALLVENADKLLATRRARLTAKPPTDAEKIAAVIKRHSAPPGIASIAALVDEILETLKP